jgi:recombination protein RecT
MNQVTSYNRGGVSKKEARVNVVSALNSRADIIRPLLPEGVTVERFLAAVGNAVLQNPDIANAPPENVFLEVSKAARDGLVLDGREAALVPFKGRVTYVPMIAGIRKRAFKTGLVKTLVTNVVYEQEYLTGKFRYNATADHPIQHEPMIVGDRGPVVAAYSFVRMDSGEVSAEVMRLDELEAIRRRSPSGNGGSWKTDTNEMYRKTVFRRHSKQLPLGDEFRAFIDSNDEPLDDMVSDEPARPVKQSAKEKFKEPEPASAADEQHEAMEPHEQDQAGDTREPDDVF